MVWGMKTPIKAGVSAHQREKKKAQILGAGALGILFVFCAPGQITTAKYSSAVDAFPEQVSPAAPTVLAHVDLRSSIEPNKPEKSAQTAPKKKTVSQIVSVDIKPKTQKPVQLASLDLDLAEITKPRDFIPNAQPIPNPKLEVLPPRRKLQKKLFGSVELRFDDERKIKAWSSVYDRFLGDVNSLKSCLNSTCADLVLSSWARELRPLQNLPKYQKIAAVNNLVNRRSYADDRRNYGRSDYWASPREFLTKGGDCEDYAILKFASLLALGVRDQDMRLVVGRLSTGTPHAFLATHVGAQEYILDNRQSQIYLTQNRNDYIPKYSMNLSNRWSHVMPSAKKI